MRNFRVSTRKNDGCSTCFVLCYTTKEVLEDVSGILWHVVDWRRERVDDYSKHTMSYDSTWYSRESSATVLAGTSSSSCSTIVDRNPWMGRGGQTATKCSFY